MVDGVKIYFRISDFKAWHEAVNIPLYFPTEKDTGAIKQKIKHCGNVFQTTITYKGKFETYFLTIKEVERKIMGNTYVSYLLIIDGSLHKNYFQGTNYQAFTWKDLQLQLAYIQEKLCLIPQNCQLVNLEFGVNIEVEFPVCDFLKQNLISYKGNRFNSYKPDKNGVCLGFTNQLSQYVVKLYDKGKQNTYPTT